MQSSTSQNLSKAATNGLHDLDGLDDLDDLDDVESYEWMRLRWDGKENSVGTDSKSKALRC